VSTVTDHGVRNNSLFHPLLSRLTLPSFRVSLDCRRTSGGSSFRSISTGKQRFHLTTNDRPDYLTFLFTLKIFTRNKISAF
jgi:hypothetical protein